MTLAVRITDATLVPANDRDRATGLLGFVTCVVNGAIRLDGLTLRRTASGSVTLSFPERRDRTGRAHPYIRPVDPAARAELVGAILRALAIQESTS